MNEGASVGSRATQKNVQKFETSGITKIVTHKQYLWNSATDSIWMEEREWLRRKENIHQAAAQFVFLSISLGSLN
jgi:hypothetical protein